MTDLTPKQFRFAQEYAVDLNGKQAAIRAGFSKHTARQKACELLSLPHVRAAVDEAKTEKGAKITKAAVRLLEKLDAQAFADEAEILDDNGNWLPIDEWPLHFRQGLVAGYETETTIERDEEGATETTTIVTKVKMANRQSIDTLLGKHVEVQAFKDHLNIMVTTRDEMEALERARVQMIPAQAAEARMLLTVIRSRPDEETTAELCRRLTVIIDGFATNPQPLTIEGEAA